MAIGFLVQVYGSVGVRVDNIQRKDEAGLSGYQERQDLPTFGVSTTTAVISAVDSRNIDIMPSSLSQVDTTVLQELPEELRADIIGALPAHRRSNCSPGRIPMEEQEGKVTGDHSGLSDAAEGKDLWVGNPPCWVHMFKLSNCLMLNILAETYMRSGSTGVLSSVLQCCLLFSSVVLLGKKLIILSHKKKKKLSMEMMSTHDSVNMVYKCMLIKGAVDFLVKPIRINELKNLWQHVWRRQCLKRGLSPQDETVAQQKLEATAENDATSDHSSSSKACAARQEECTKKGSDAQSVSFDRESTMDELYKGTRRHRSEEKKGS